MFSISDILDIAIRIEENGERIYRQASGQVGDPRLASLLEHLADEEVEHARWFSAQLGSMPAAEADSALAQMGRDLLRGVVGERCFSLDEVDLTRMESVIEVLDTAFDLENDTVVFYEMLIGFVQDPALVEQLQRIIREEMRHAQALADYVSTGAVSAVESAHG